MEKEFQKLAIVIVATILVVCKLQRRPKLIGIRIVYKATDDL
jgi:hypothetical protein